jgi:hypothetical protein
MQNTSVELVANIWPIVGRDTGIIQRFSARAYAMPMGDDKLISTVLRGLAGTDFHTAKQYPVPEQFRVVEGTDVMYGAVPPHGFEDRKTMVVEAAFEDMASSCPNVVGISMKDAWGNPHSGPGRFSLGIARHRALRPPRGTR